MVGPEITRRLPYCEQLKFTYHQGLTALTFLSMSYFYNYAKKRPIGAGVLRHIAAGLAGLYAGKEVDRLYEWRRNRKVIVIEDYICKHPEDFPLTTPQKYKDILQSWYPVR